MSWSDLESAVAFTSWGDVFRAAMLVGVFALGWSLGPVVWNAIF